MSRSKPRDSAPWSDVKLLAMVVLELTVWMVIPALFLAVYVLYFGRSPDAVLPHARLAATAWLLGVAARFVLRKRAAEGRTARMVLAGSVAAFVVAGLVYYGLVLVGLAFWNQVVPWELALALAAAARPVTGVAAVPLLILTALLVAAYLVVWRGVWLYLSEWDWTQRAARQFHPLSMAVAVTAIIGLAAVQTAGLTLGQWSALDEPLSLTIGPPVVYFEIHALGDHLMWETDVGYRQVHFPIDTTGTASFVEFGGLGLER
jgi:hypothetical protein